MIRDRNCITLILDTKFPWLAYRIMDFNIFDKGIAKQNFVSTSSV